MRHTLTTTKNVKKAEAQLQYLLTRPRAEMVGLGLFYGPPGTGKTRYAMRKAFDENYVYLRLEAAMTHRGFLVKLSQSLQYMYAAPMPLKGNTQQLYNDVLDMLVSASEPPTIFIDEVDYAFRHKGIIGSIRDMVDQSLATIVLFGMQNAKAELLRLNAHYFDRCNSFAEFKNFDIDDTALICKEVCEIELTPDAVKWVHNTSKGCARQIVKTLDFVERKSKEKKIAKFSLGDVK